MSSSYYSPKCNIVEITYDFNWNRVLKQIYAAGARGEPVQCVICGEVLEQTNEFITVLAYYEKPPAYQGVKLEHYTMTVLPKKGGS